MMELHHIGIVTGNLIESKETLIKLGYEFTDTVYDPLQNVHLTITKGIHKIELVEPCASNNSLNNLVKNKGEHAYHICFCFQSIEKAEVEKIIGHRLVMLSPPQSAILFDGARVAFYWSKNIGLIECLEVS